MDKAIRHLISLVFFLMASELCAPSGPPVWAGPPPLSEVVFYGIQPASSLFPGNGRPAGGCTRKYLQALSSRSFLWSATVPSDPEKAVAVRRRNLVEQIVVIMGPKTRCEADAFSSKLPLHSEWEGMSDGPVAEADFAGRWISGHPRSAITPFLLLFQAHRLRAGYEAARASGRTEVCTELADRYRKCLERAWPYRKNPLIACLADDLEVQNYVYLEGQGRP